MGVRVDHYVMLGIKIPYPKVHEELYIKLFCKEPSDEVQVIADGMNGSYVFIGEVLSRGSEEEGFVDIVSIDASTVEFSYKRGELSDKIHRIFDLDFSNSDLKIYVFTHRH